jgi:hypothetical protein
MIPSIVAHTPRILSEPSLNGLEKARAVWILVRLRLCRMGWMLSQVITDKA